METWDARIAVVNGDRVENEKGLAERYVAVPGMNAVCAALALELPDCRSRWEVSEIHFHDGCWELVSSEGDRLISDAVVVTVPPSQALALFQGIEFANALADIEMQPCWALMAVFDRPLLSDYDAAFVNQGPLSWLARQASRPGRSDEEAWVLHAGPEWSREHLDDEPENIQKLMLRAAFDIPIAQRCEVTFAAVHRWRYALARNPLEKGAICFEERRLAFAGDWCHGSRVEGAFLSGVTAADRILALASENRG